jgi:hypothetical protein
MPASQPAGFVTNFQSEVWPTFAYRLVSFITEEVCRQFDVAVQLGVDRAFADCHAIASFRDPPLVDLRSSAQGAVDQPSASHRATPLQALEAQRAHWIR